MEASFSAQLLRATLFAARAHAGQVRKGAAAEPYVNHVIEVAAILAEHGAPEQAILAGLLHDTVEDTETTDADLVAVFGPIIAGLVAEATDDTEKPKEIRKALQISQAPKHSEAAKQLKLADKISNLRSIADSPPANWNHARRIEYVGWAGRVAAGLKGVNPGLDALFDTTYRAAFDKACERNVMKRRLFLASAGLLAVPSLARAQQRGITLLVPFAEGGSTDQVMRAVAKYASKALGQEVRLDNKPSRTGLRLFSQLRSAPADGSVVMLFPVATLRALVERGVDFNMGRDATPIMCLAGGTYGAIAKADRFPGGWRDFVAEARQKPGQLSFGSVGVGSVGHVTMARLMVKENIQLVHLPFRGAADGVESLMAGDLDVMAGGARLHTAVDQGEARWLTLWSPTRNARWPDVPTLVELGYGLTETAPFGLIGPPNMPAAERKRLEEAFTAALRSPQVRSVMARLGMTEDLRDSAAYSAYLAAAAGEEAALGLRPEARQ